MVLAEKMSAYSFVPTGVLITNLAGLHVRKRLSDADRLKITSLQHVSMVDTNLNK